MLLIISQPLNIFNFVGKFTSHELIFKFFSRDKHDTREFSGRTGPSFDGEKGLFSKDLRELLSSRKSSHNKKLAYQIKSSPRSSLMEIEWHKNQSSNDSKLSKRSQNSSNFFNNLPELLSKNSGSITATVKDFASECLTDNEKPLVFCRVGDLYQLDDSYQFIIMQESVKLGIRHLGKGSFQLEVLDSKDELLYVQAIEDTSSYMIDFEGELFKWFNVEEEVLRVIGFKFHENVKSTLEELCEVLADDSSIQNSLPTNSAISRKGQSASMSDSAVRTNLLNRYDDEFSCGAGQIKGFMEEEFEEISEKPTREEESAMRLEEDEQEEEAFPIRRSIDTRSQSQTIMTQPKPSSNLSSLIEFL